MNPNGVLIIFIIGIVSASAVTTSLFMNINSQPLRLAPATGPLQVKCSQLGYGGSVIAKITNQSPSAVELIGVDAFQLGLKLTAPLTI